MEIELETFLNSLLEWRYVGPTREYEKYFRYACFSLKWRKITKQPEKVAYYIQSFIEASQREQDVSVSIVNLLQITDFDPALKAELMEAASVVLTGSTKGLNRKEIAAAKKIATETWQQSVVEEGIIDQSL